VVVLQYQMCLFLSVLIAGRRVERDELQNELSKRLSGKPAIKTKPQNHNLYLSTKSSAYDVTEWLRSKSFSER
jgi:hypothetical protein